MYQRVGKRAYKKDLENIISLCEVLDNPQDRFKSVHIAGTNGKGSSAHMIAAILQSAGYQTGLYTSPHLKNFTERIRVDGVEIEQQTVVDFVQEHKALLKKIKPSFFEVTVAMAFDYFANREVDIAVIEVGLGGRLDSTNIITPEVSLITNISFDHQDILGHTLELIALEKAGIIKKKVPVVIGKTQSSVGKIFKRIVAERVAPIIFAEEKYPFTQNNFELQLQGNYQRQNVPGVLSVIDQLIKKEYNISSEHIKFGLANTVNLTGIKGRWQTLEKKPLVICDTGHNINGIQVLMKQLLSIPCDQLYIVFGMVDDKDAESILRLLPKVAYYYFCQSNSPRAKNAQTLCSQAKQIGLRGEVIEEVNRAIEVAKQQAGVDDLIFIGGSTFVIAEIKNL